MKYGNKCMYCLLWISAESPPSRWAWDAACTVAASHVTGTLASPPPVPTISRETSAWMCLQRCMAMYLSYTHSSELTLFYPVGAPEMGNVLSHCEDAFWGTFWSSNMGPGRQFFERRPFFIQRSDMQRRGDHADVAWTVEACMDMCQQYALEFMMMSFVVDDVTSSVLLLE